MKRHSFEYMSEKKCFSSRHLFLVILSVIIILNVIFSKINSVSLKIEIYQKIVQILNSNAEDKKYSFLWVTKYLNSTCIVIISCQVSEKEKYWLKLWVSFTCLVAYKILVFRKFSCKTLKFITCENSNN